jgi:UDP-N-acetylmuramyl tripeptide synthase
VRRPATRTGGSGPARRAVRAAGRTVEWVLGRPLASYDGPVAFEAKVGVARAARRVEHRRSRGNVAVPGHVLLRAAPRALGRLVARLPGGTTVVSASGGKTTTTAMLSSIARHAGRRAISNPSGANMPPGLVAELLAVTRAGRGTAGDVAVFEVDERWLVRVADELDPRVIVLGNVLRDQVDRMGDLDDLLAMWRAMVLARPAGMRLVLNVDDPRVATLAELRADPVCFGVDDVRLDRAATAVFAEPPACAGCGAELRYEVTTIAHLGRWCCGRCGRRRPDLDVAAEDVTLTGTAEARFTLRLPDGRHPVRLRVGGLHNVYNAVAAAAGAQAMGLPAGAVVAGLEATSPAWGRGEVVRVEGVDVVLQLVKAGVGAATVFRTVLEEPGELDVLLAAQSDRHDLADFPWLWDVDVDALLERIRTLVCAGDQWAELALRLKYAGAGDVAEVEPSLAAGFRRAVAASAGRLHVLATPRAAEELRELLADEGHVGRWWR